MKKILVFATTLMLLLILTGCNSQVRHPYQLPEEGTIGDFQNYSEIQAYLDEYFPERGQYRYYYGLPGLMLENSVDDVAVSATSESGYSKTNVQVEGVDELDSVITNGTSIYVASSNHFYIINPNTLSIEYTQEYENESIYGMYLYDNTLVVLTNYYQYNAAPDSVIWDIYDFLGYRTYETGIYVRVYDVTSSNDVKATRTLFLDNAYYVNTRMIDNTLYLITNDNGYFQSDSLYIPEYIDSVTGSSLQKLAAENIHYLPNGSQYLSFMTLVSIQVDTDTEADINSYIGSASQIYSSLNNLYLISSRYVFNEDQTYQYMTYVIRFSYEESLLEFQAVSEVDGNPLNQYSMDEYNGVFRIATTTYSNPITNTLFLLDVSQDHQMDLISKLTGLGKENERIYSVRYMNDIAYVVTFVNTDPLYKIDLSDPKNPVILGELYEDGVSDYLHPVTDHLLLGVGRASELINGFTRFTGVKVSLYDTSLETPVNLSAYFVDGEYSYSPVTYDPKQFNYFVPSGQEYMYVMIPISKYTLIEDEEQSYSRWQYIQSEYVFKVGFDGTLEFVTELSHNSDSYFDTIEKALIIGNNMYTISNASIHQFDMSNHFVEINKTDLEKDYYFRYFGYLID